MTNQVVVDGKNYNDGAYNASTNPFGLANGGNKFNFVPAMLDTLVAASQGWVGQSTTTLTVGTGSKAFTQTTAIAFQPTMTVTAYSISDPTKSMTGTVTSVVGLVVTVNVTATTGSGSASDWGLYAQGSVGPAGPSFWNTYTFSSASAITAATKDTVIAQGSGAQTVNLPAGAVDVRVRVFNANTGGNDVPVHPAGTDKFFVNGAATSGDFTLDYATFAGKGVEFYHDGTNWRVIQIGGIAL